MQEHLKNVVSQFVLKLLDILDKFSDCVEWSEDGLEFVITNQNKFIQMVLPVYFRHEKFQSFVRQLNMYNFHKVCRKKNSISFRNQYFLRGNSNNYHLIKRRKKNQAQNKRKQHEVIKGIVSQCQKNLSIGELIDQLLFFKDKSIGDISDLKKTINSFNKDLSVKSTHGFKQHIHVIKDSINNIQELNKKFEQDIIETNEPNTSSQLKITGINFNVNDEKQQNKLKMSQDLFHQFKSISSFII